MEFVVDGILIAGLIYLIVGVLFSIYFYRKGAVKIDAGVTDTPWHFKAIIFPGVVLFWLPLLMKVIKS